MKSSVIALVVLAMQTLSTQDALKGPFPKADHRVAYGKDPLQFGDLRLPEGKGPYPVAIVIHGGCWLAEYDLEYMGRLSAALTKAGIATWTIEYRRVGNPGGGYPGTFDDVEAAAAYVATLAKKHPIDASRVAAVGHSAGGHLALWLASGTRASQQKLKGVVSLAGVTDLRAAAAGKVCGDAIPRLMGDADYAKFSPSEMPAPKIPVHLIHGEQDRLVPVKMSRDYAQGRKSAGNVTLTVIPGAGHFELVTPGSAAWPAVESAVLGLLRGPVR